MKKRKIIEEFEKEYAYLIPVGLQVEGIAQLQPHEFVISISVPFVFDHRAIPKNFMGLNVKSSTRMIELPKEFSDLNPEKDYVWAYQRFEKYAKGNEEEIKKKLNKPNITKEEILDALCFGDFNEHKSNCIKWEKEGKIPKYQ